VAEDSVDGEPALAVRRAGRRPCGSAEDHGGAFFG
jgi:hypothetical protein